VVGVEEAGADRSCHTPGQAADRRGGRHGHHRLLGLFSGAGHHDLEEERETTSRVLKISNQLGREGLNGGRIDGERGWGKGSSPVGYPRRRRACRERTRRRLADRHARTGREEKDEW
jgi:hypothetical protein